MPLTNCTHEGNGLVDKTFGIANTLAVFVNEILKGIGFSNPALFIPHCLYETYTTPHISSYSVCIKSKISFIWSYCIKHISIN